MTVQKNNDHGKDRKHNPGLHEAASIMSRNDTSAEEKHNAAVRMGKEGSKGHNGVSPHANKHEKDK